MQTWGLRLFETEITRISQRCRKLFHLANLVGCVPKNEAIASIYCWKR
jgi:hypothetical protein